jgi:AraC-like DNA-binding protein
MDKFTGIKKVFHHLDIDTPFSVVGGYLREGKGLFHGDSHYAPQMVIVLSGQQEVYYPDFHDTFEAGQVWWTSCWEPHVNRVTGNYFSYVAVTISLDAIGSLVPFHEIDWLMPFFLHPSERPKPTGRKLRCEILRLGREILRLDEHKPYGFQTMQWLKIHEIILKNFLLLDHTPDGGHRARRSGIIQILPAIQLVKSKLDQVISLEEAAAECSLSKSRFSEIFTKNMNVSFSRFALRVRISTAAHMLRNSNLSIKEVAARCGFQETSHFYHVFARNFKCTPNEFVSQRN